MAVDVDVTVVESVAVAVAVTLVSLTVAESFTVGAILGLLFDPPTEKPIPKNKAAVTKTRMIVVTSFVLSMCFDIISS